MYDADMQISCITKNPTSLDMENSSANNSITQKRVEDIKSPPEALVTLIFFHYCSFGGETSLVYTYAQQKIY